MIIHIALFKWKKEANPEEIDEIMNELRSLKKLDCVEDLYCGENFSKWANGYTHAIVGKFKDKESLEKYRKDPKHIPIAKKIEKLEADSIGIDFEA